MIDLFHLQLIKGNITNTLNDLKSHIGHVQVSGNVDSLARSLSGVQNYGQYFGMGAKKRLISEHYLIFYSSLFLSRLFLHTECTRFSVMVLLLPPVNFNGAFVVFVRSTVVLLFKSCLLFFASSLNSFLSLAFFFFCDVKMNLCNVYLLYASAGYKSLTLYLYIWDWYTYFIGTWQVGGEFLFDLILRNIHFQKLMCVFVLLLLLFVLLFVSFFFVYFSVINNSNSSKIKHLLYVAVKFIRSHFKHIKTIVPKNTLNRAKKPKLSEPARERERRKFPSRPLSEIVDFFVCSVIFFFF